MLTVHGLLANWPQHESIHACTSHSNYQTIVALNSDMAEVRTCMVKVAWDISLLKG